MLRFLNSEYLNYLFFLPVLALLYYLYYRSKKKALKTFADVQLHSILFSAKSFLKEHIKFAIFLAALALAVIAYARPQWGTRVDEYRQEGIDIFILLDVSRSMGAQDLTPNRLENAKLAITNLLKNLRGDRVGLIIFAGSAYTLFPITTDYLAAQVYLSGVDLNAIPVQGTALAEAIEKGVSSFDSKTKNAKVMIVISDGEDHEGDIETALSHAASADITVYSIGVGSPEGVPIPVTDELGNPVGLKRDSKGELVLTKLNEELMKKIAEDGGGKYYRASGDMVSLLKILDDFENMDKVDFGARKFTNYEDRYFWFLTPALFLLLLELLISERKTKRFGRLFRKFQS